MKEKKTGWAKILDTSIPVETTIRIRKGWELVEVSKKIWGRTSFAEHGKHYMVKSPEGIIEFQDVSFKKAEANFGIYSL